MGEAIKYGAGPRRPHSPHRRRPFRIAPGPSARQGRPYRRTVRQCRSGSPCLAGP